MAILMADMHLYKKESKNSHLGGSIQSSSVLLKDCFIFSPRSECALLRSSGYFA